MSKLRICISVLIGFFVGTSVVAQDTDLNQKVADMLNGFGPVPVTTMISIPHQEQVCHRTTCSGRRGGECGDDICHAETRYTSQPKTTSQVLSASNIRPIKVGDITWGTLTQTQIPDKIYVDNSETENCSGAANPLTHSSTLTVQFARTATTQLQHSVTHIQGQQIGLDSGGLLPFKVSAQLSFSQQTLSSTTTIDSTQQTVTRAHTQSVTVPAGSHTIVQLRVWPVRYTLPFSTTIIIDSDVSPNDKGYKTLADIFPDPATRTFSITGIVQADDASEGDVVQMSAPYDPALCQQATSHVADHVVPSKKLKLRAKKEADDK
jgi:hypothetical protein